MATICSAAFHFPRLLTFTACTKQMAPFLHSSRISLTPSSWYCNGWCFWMPF